MPGLHLVHDWNGGLESKQEALSKALGSLLHDGRYEQTILLKGDSYFLAQTGYRAYPVEAFQLEGVSAFVEGRLYGVRPSTLQDKLRELACLAFGENEGDGLREWLLGCDGDFVVILFHQSSGQLRIINDVFGRLPLYWHSSTNGFIVSRELRFIARLLERPKFDRMALANFLLSGYVLGQRTWLEGVDRLAPATLMQADPARPGVKLQRLHEFNFESKAHANRSIQENGAHLTELFSASCEARQRPDVQNVLSLSGGFDSRAIGAAFWRLGIPFRCMTFLDHVGNAIADVPIARRLAELFGAEWKLVHLPPPTRKEALKLLRMKNGLNPLGMSFLLTFLEEVRAGSSAEIYFISGEMGTFILPDPRPARALASVKELAAFLVQQYLKFPLPSVAALTGVDEADILGDLEQYLFSYPEEDTLQKHVHFVVSERAFRWQSEAEDRNRSYFWSITPFSSTDFFCYAMGCPDQQKSSYALYHELLFRLMPSATAVEHAGLRAPIASEQFIRAYKVAQLIASKPNWRRRLKGAPGAAETYGRDSLVLHCLEQQLASCDVLADYLSIPAAKAIVAQARRHTTEQLDHLFTVTSVIEDLATGKSVLEEDT